LATASAAGFLSNTAPLFSAVLAIAIGEKTTRRSWLALVIGLAGVWLISLSLSGGFVPTLGCLVLLLAAFCWAAFFVLQKSLLERYSPLDVTCYAVWTGTVLLAIFLPGAVMAARTASLPATLAAVYLGILPTAFAYVCWSYVLSNMPISQAAVYSYLVPVISVLMSWAWLGERPTILFCMGAGTVLVGVTLAHRSSNVFLPTTREGSIRRERG